ncbi:hypothetical protein D3C78_1490450 [compost metagenome]
MPEHFIQHIPDMCPVKPFAFLADDHLRDCLRLRRQSERCLQFFCSDLADAVGVDDVEQAAPDRSLIFVVGQGAVAFQLCLAEVTHAAHERRHGMDGPAVVVQDLVAFPVPGTDPGRHAHVFADPAVEQIAGGVVQ